MANKTTANAFMASAQKSKREMADIQKEGSGKRSASSRVRWRRLWKSRKRSRRSEGKQTATTSKSESTILIIQMQSRKDK